MKPVMRALATITLATAFAAALPDTAWTQEMEPRSYSSAPIGMNFVVASAGNSRGDVLFDPSVPITDVSADLNLASTGYARSFGLAGRQGMMAVGWAYARGDIEGKVSEVDRRTGRSGLADMRIRASLNLLGPGAMTREQFATAPRRTILGVSLTVQAPTGQYDPERLINLGTNRWAFKPEIGVSVPAGRWFLDLYAGMWLYTDNDAFYPGESTRKQDPLWSAQAHASYTFRTHAWLAFDASWYGGGDSTIDGGPPSTRQSNTRLGGTGSIPITKRQSIKIAYSTGATSRAGTDFNTGLVAWQISWFDRTPAPRPQ